MADAFLKPERLDAAARSAADVDPLLESLLAIARLHGLPASANALRAGLPLPDDCLSPALVARAAKRAGLSARVVKRPLNEISDLLTPAILLLKDNQSCVLLDPVSKGSVRVLLPDTDDGETQLEADKLAELYTGYAVLARPTHRFDDRTPSVRKDDKRHWFWGVILKPWRIYRDVLLASLLINAFAVASPLFVMNVYDRVVPNQALDTLWVLAIGVAVVMVFDLLLRTLRGHFVDVAGRKADLELSAKIFERVLGMRQDAKPASVGAFANSLREFESIRDFFASVSVTALVDVPFAVLFLLVIYLVAGPLVLVPLAAIPIIIGYGAIIQPALRRSAENASRASSQKSAILVEALTESEAVKVLGTEGRIQRAWEEAVGQIATWSAKSRFLSLTAANLAMSLQQLVTVAVVVAGVYLVSESELSLGALIAAVMLSGRAVAPMAQVAGLATRYNQAFAALEALNQVMEMPVERPEDKVFLTRPVLQGDVEFEHVTFCYPGQDIPALRNVSFKISNGEKVAIIGRIGSGKSTVQRLIVGLYNAQEGAVRVDGADVRQLDPGDLRRNVAFVSQDVPLFYGTVRENLTMGIPHAEDEAILRAAELAGVSRFVNRQPLGFDMPVGERGERLSGGQRQSLALARAMLLDPPVYLLDEPTGSMDNSSEEAIKRSIASVTNGKTLIIVTHRASLLELVDRIIVMDNGVVAADGPRDQVVEALRSGRIRTGK